MSVITTERFDGNTNNDRFFLVYYALDDTLNLSGWGVSSESLERNIRSFIGKPVVLKHKDQFSESDRNQVGNFVHPVLKNASLSDNLSYQELFAVGRINDVSLTNKGWRFDVEIIDPQMKQAYKAGTFESLYPRHVSPQIATFPDQYPDERDDNVQKWHGLHLALVDVPAYGFQKADVKGKCYGSEQECTVKLRSAVTISEEEEEKERQKAMQMFLQEKTKVRLELEEAQRRYNDRRKFTAQDALELHDRIMDRWIIG
jgi:hypothetical protein